ncbi:MAG: hypothetical protein RLZZ32_961 [Cyanobacteriota bacterium]|jgi:hypothetical protein
MERLTVVEIEQTMREMGSNLEEAEQHLRFLAGGCGAVYRVTAHQRRQLEHAAELLKLSRRIALEAGDESTDA